MSMMMPPAQQGHAPPQPGHAPSVGGHAHLDEALPNLAPPNFAVMEDNDRRIVQEFISLLEKSRQLFNGLRDLPPYGQKQWQSYFGRTFDVYTKLWKYQQTNRTVLDQKYGLRRPQIGDIASKIGQLYYHY